jgi:hypothetical protein
MAVQLDFFGVERLPATVPFQKGVDYLQRPFIKQDRERADDFTSKETVECQS